METACASVETAAEVIAAATGPSVAGLCSRRGIVLVRVRVFTLSDFSVCLLSRVSLNTVSVLLL